MNRLPLAVASPENPLIEPLLARVQAQLGRVPNLYRAMANAPAALEGYLAFREQLVQGRFDTALRERLALAIAAANDCGYCVAAHSFRGKKVGLSDEELAHNRAGRSTDPHADAALQLATTILTRRGQLPDSTFDQAHRAGLSHADIAEVMAHVALNTFSNWFSHVAEPELDFPAVAPSTMGVPTSVDASPAQSALLERVAVKSSVPRPWISAVTPMPKRDSEAQQALAVWACDFPSAVQRLRARLFAAGLIELAYIDTTAVMERAGYAVAPIGQVLAFHPQYMEQILRLAPAGITAAPLKFALVENTADTPDQSPQTRLHIVDPVVSFGEFPPLTKLGQELSALVHNIIDAADHDA